MLATFSEKMGGRKVASRGRTVASRGHPLSYCVSFFFDFFAVLTPSWPHFGSISGPLGPILARFWKILAPFWLHFEASGRYLWRYVGHFGAIAGTGWAGGVTRSVKN